MLEDRDYMRQPESPEPGWTPSSARAWPLTIWFLISYVLVYVAELAVQKFVAGGPAIIDNYFVLSNEGLRHGFVWQLLTYQFMHAGWVHLILNSCAIYSFGIPLERMLGERKFIALMLSSGIVGGICQSFAAFIWPLYFSGGVVGASASAFGLVATFALLWPEQELTMYVLYFIPVNLRAKTLLYVLGGLALAGFSFPGLAGKLLGPVAHVAHLGGMFTGIFFVEKIIRGNWFQRDPYAAEDRRIKRAAAGKTAPVDLSMQEVDAILDKISAKGIGSLSARERDLLESARKRMRGT